MRKILFLDTWDKGYRNFTRLNKEFNDKGFQTLLVHTGSFSNEATYTEKVIDGLIIRDIVYYNTIKLRKVILEEKPDVILILNLSYLLDRAIINIAKSYRIKTVYLAHGKLTAPTLAAKAKKDLNSSIWKKPSRFFKKKNFYSLLNYANSLDRKNRFFSIFKKIISILKSPASYLDFPKFNPELDADLLLVYTEEDKELYTKSFNFPPEKVKAVGNPEISSFITQPIKSAEENSQEIGNNHFNKYALYLDDGFATDNLWTYEQWYSHIKELKAILNNQNLELIIKLHPRIDLQDHRAFFTENRIIAYSDLDFKNVIHHASIIISHYSSTIIYALILKKPVLSPRWGISKNITMNYPEDLIKYCYSEEEFSQNLLSYKLNTSIVNNYLRDNDINPEADSIKLIIDEINKQFN